MEENPYQSPKSYPKVEKPPAEPPNRFFSAAVCGVGTLGGLFIWQAILTGFPLEFLFLAPPYKMLLFFLIPGTVSLAVASCAWRFPESWWPIAVATLLWASSLALWFIGGLFFGLP